MGLGILAAGTAVGTALGKYRQAQTGAIHNGV